MAIFPKYHYVSAVDPDRLTRRWLVAGPYLWRTEALARVQRIKVEAAELDDRAHWLAWGTAAGDEELPTLLGVR